MCHNQICVTKVRMMEAKENFLTGRRNRRTFCQFSLGF